MWKKSLFCLNFGPRFNFFRQPYILKGLYLKNCDSLSLITGVVTESMQNIDFISYDLVTAHAPSFKIRPTYRATLLSGGFYAWKSEMERPSNPSTLKYPRLQHLTLQKLLGQKILNRHFIIFLF